MLAKPAATAPLARAEPCREAGTAFSFDSMITNDDILLNGESAFAENLAIDVIQPRDLYGKKDQKSDPIFDEFLTFEMESLSRSPALEGMSMSFANERNYQSGSWCAWMRGNFSLAGVNEVFVANIGSNTLMESPLGRPHALHSADLIIHSLRAFPTMMLRRETFPWFIHPHSNSLPMSAGAGLPEALCNCISIAQMFISRTNETRPFLHRTIGAEYRRLNLEVRSTSDYTPPILTFD